MVKNLPANGRDTGDVGSIPGWGKFRGVENSNLLQYSYLGREDPLEEGMATHSSILAWRISKDRGSLAGDSPQCCKESDTTETT